MAALLVSIAVMGVLMSVAMPVWRHDAQREKEAELIWRAGQIVRGIELYKKRVANANPPNLDVLVQQKFLRKKYKDPMTKDGEWRYLSPQEMQGMAFGVGGLPGQTGRAGMPGTGAPGTGAPGSGGGRLPGSEPTGAQSGSGFGSGSGESSSFGAPRGTQYNGPVAGVVSKSKENSIRIFKGRTRYDQWIVTIDDVRPRNQQQQQPGQQPGQPGSGLPGSGFPSGGQPGGSQPGGSRPGGGLPQSPGGQRPPM